jgi:ketosteroid isomerase-like protein
MAARVEQDGRAVLMRFWEAVEQKDLDAMTAFAHPDIEMEWPQSGERFRGRDNAVGALLATEERAEPTGEPRIVGADNTWVVIAPVRYGSDPYWYIGLFEVEDGLARRATEFFGASFPAQPGRASFAEPRAAVPNAER